MHINFDGMYLLVTACAVQRCMLVGGGNQAPRQVENGLANLLTLCCQDY